MMLRAALLGFRHPGNPKLVCLGVEDRTVAEHFLYPKNSGTPGKDEGKHLR